MSYRNYVILIYSITLFASPAHALCLLNHSLHYKYPTQRMDEALQNFSHRSGCSIQITPDAMKDRHTPAFHGQYRPLSALRHLLKDNTDLRVKTSDTGFLVRDIQHRT